MAMLYVSGGCRSGKSAYAQTWVEMQSAPHVFLATALPLDGETRERVAVHQAARGMGWISLEPADALWLAPEEHVGRAARLGKSLLFDCLTLWVSGCAMHGLAKAQCLTMLDRLLAAMRQSGLPSAIVSNELGMGLVPPTAELRSFRDLAGEANQRAAAMADQVVFMVSGQPLPVR